MFTDPRVRRIRFTYTNHRGETREREAIGPFEMVLTATDHHPDRQWILSCYDADKGTGRSFAMKDMRDVRVAEEEDAYARCHNV